MYLKYLYMNLYKDLLQICMYNLKILPTYSNGNVGNCTEEWDKIQPQIKETGNLNVCLAYLQYY